MIFLFTVFLVYGFGTKHINLVKLYNELSQIHIPLIDDTGGRDAEFGTRGK